MLKWVMNMVRTTLKVRKDILDRAKELSFRDDVPLYEVFNSVWDLGFRIKSDKEYRRRSAFKAIDEFRKHAAKHGPFNTDELIRLNKLDQK